LTKAAERQADARIGLPFGIVFLISLNVQASGYIEIPGFNDYFDYFQNLEFPQGIETPKLLGSFCPLDIGSSMGTGCLGIGLPTDTNSFPTNGVTMHLNHNLWYILLTIHGFQAYN
jgi:hypothetical protein